MRSPSNTRSRAAAVAAPDAAESLLQAGCKATAVAVAAIGALATGNALQQTVQAPAPTDAPREASVLTSIAATPMQEAVAATPVYQSAARARIAPVSETLPATTPAVEASVADAPLITVTPNQTAPAVLTGPSEHKPSFTWRRAAGRTVTATPRVWSNTAPPDVASRLETMADGIVSERTPPVAGARDLALFVASDDKQVAWSMSKANPDYRAVTYEEDRVEMGNVAAGVAMSVNNLQVAAAYVERDAPSRYGSHDEKYAGFVLTYRH